MKAYFSTLLSLIIFTVDGIAQEGNYSFKETYKVSTPAKLAISSSDGNIEVVPSENDQIEVVYIVRKNNKLLKIDRSTLEKELSLDVNSTQNSLSIVVKYPPGSHNLDWRSRINVSFKVYTPRTTSSELKTSDGNISVEGLSSNQLCKTSDGNINISDLKGEVKGFTSDGNIQAKEINGASEFGTSDGNINVENLTGNLQASTSDGNIELNKVKGDISARTSDGDISFNNLSGSFTASTSDGSIRGSLNSLGKKLSLKTTDGDISASIPANQGLDLNIKGSSIDAPLKNFSGKSDKKYVQGAINGGGIPVELTTTDGSVTLSYR